MNLDISRQKTLQVSDAELLADEAKYCSFGDTVHYSDPPKIFARGEGSYLYDTEISRFIGYPLHATACIVRRRGGADNR